MKKRRPRQQRRAATRGLAVANATHRPAMPTSGTVKTSMDHPSQGKTQMFRRGLSEAQFQAVLLNPRAHTGRCDSRRTPPGSGRPGRRCRACMPHRPISFPSLAHAGRGYQTKRFAPY